MQFLQLLPTHWARRQVRRHAFRLRSVGRAEGELGQFFAALVAGDHRGRSIVNVLEGEAQLGEAFADVRLYGSQGGGQTFGDLLVAESLVVGEFHRLALAVVEFGQRCGDSHFQFGVGGGVFGRGGGSGEFVLFGRAADAVGAGLGARGLASQAVDRSAAGESHQVRPGAAPRGVIPIASLPHFPKHVRDGVFGVGAVMQNPFAQGEHLRGESIVQRAEGPPVAAAHRRQQHRAVRQVRYFRLFAIAQTSASEAFGCRARLQGSDVAVRCAGGRRVLRQFGGEAQSSVPAIVRTGNAGWMRWNEPNKRRVIRDLAAPLAAGSRNELRG